MTVDVLKLPVSAITATTHEGRSALISDIRDKPVLSNNVNRKINPFVWSLNTGMYLFKKKLVEVNLTGIIPLISLFSTALYEFDVIKLFAKTYSFSPVYFQAFCIPQFPVQIAQT